jgi:two-component system OmpR family response regulator
MIVGSIFTYAQIVILGFNIEIRIRAGIEVHFMDGLRIVLLDADSNYRWKLSSFLGAHGYRVTLFETLGEMHDTLCNPEWAIYLVNFGANTNQGLEFLSAGERANGSVLVLSDSDDHVDRIVCLELGADDYIVKTTHHREILARVRVAQRRGPSALLPFLSPRTRGTDITPASWRFLPEVRELLTPEGRRIDLTTDQFGLLDTLIKHTGKALSRNFLSRALFDRPLKAGDRSIDNLVVRLRRRLGESARAPRIIKTARTGGYFFDGFPEPSGTATTRAVTEERYAA